LSYLIKSHIITFEGSTPEATSQLKY